jgi:hemerythrin HHE cation binding domain-containing protein
MSLELSHGAAIERRIVEQEHRELSHSIARIEEVANLVGSLGVSDLASAIDDLVRRLRKGLLAHAEWEDAWLYPQMDLIAGTPWATRMMRFEHQQIAGLVDLLTQDSRRLRERSGPTKLEEIRGHLCSLHTMVQLHVEREAHFLIPLLDVAGADA